MLRAAVKAGTVVGLRAKDIMERGELVPDEVVVADRRRPHRASPTPKNGFILDGFPRTVPQAVALDKMLKEKGLKLDGVIELKVDGRHPAEPAIENRLPRRPRAASRCAPTTIRRCSSGGVDAYREQTAPLVDYYRWQGSLKSVDGMQPIDDGRGRDPQGADREAAGRKPARQAATRPAQGNAHGGQAEAKAEAKAEAAGQTTGEDRQIEGKPAQKACKTGHPRLKGQSRSGPQGAAKEARRRAGPPPAAKLPRASPNASRG